MDVRIKRIYKPDTELVIYLYRKAGMKHQVTNRRFFDKEDNILLVSFIDDIPCGFLYAYTLESINSVKPKMFLYSIDVFPEFQSKGIGTRMIEKLKDISKDKNCSEIFVFTNDSNNKAKRLYEKTGGNRENLDDVMYVYDI